MNEEQLNEETLPEQEELRQQANNFSNGVSGAMSRVNNYAKNRSAVKQNSGLKSTNVDPNNNENNKINIPDSKSQNINNQASSNKLPSDPSSSGLEKNNKIKDGKNKKSNTNSSSPNSSNSSGKGSSKETDLTGRRKSSSKGKKSSPNKAAKKVGKSAKDKLLKQNLKNKAKKAIIAFLISHSWIILLIAGAALIILLLVPPVATTIVSGFTAIKSPGVLCNLKSPLSEFEVISQFSWRLKDEEAEAHKGVDLEADENSEVFAAQSGTIVDYGYDDHYGNYIKIDHGELDGKKFYTFYAHLSDESSSLDLSNGDTVSKGTIIGYVGNTGETDGYYLHFEVINGSTQVSPNRLFGYQDPTGSCHPIESIDTTKEEIAELNCETMIPLAEDDNLDVYCDSCYSKNFIWPTPKYTNITDDFGPRESPTPGASSNHGGIDIGAPGGANIVAAASGTVELAKYNGGYGNCVMIKHENGMTTLYAHMSKIIATENSKVSQGQVIGLVGSTGVSTGNHLHFEIRMVDGTKVNPLNYVTANEEEPSREYCPNGIGEEIIAIAREEVGVWNNGDFNSRKAQITKYLASTGLGYGYAYCAAFVRWTLTQVGVYDKLGIPGNGASVSQYKNAPGGTYHKLGDGYTPKAGDLAIFSYGHIEILVSYENGVLHTIGGNSGPTFSGSLHSVLERTNRSTSGFAGVVEI